MLQNLLDQVSALLGRDAEVSKTKDGKYVVLFMSFSLPPPPKGETPEEALEKFIEWYGKVPKEQLPEE